MAHVPHDHFLEGAVSRVRIVKNRFRSMMLDDWLSSPLCLASEKETVFSMGARRHGQGGTCPSLEML